MDHIKELNEMQKSAVLHKEGPIMIIAGAGTGKTRVITHRILNLIKEGVDPRKILAITFTNKAAKEMKERVMSLIEKDESVNFPTKEHSTPFLGTFHSLGVFILRKNAQKIGLTRHFSIYDRNDSLRAIKDSLNKCDLDPKQYPPKKFLSAISKKKGEGMTHDEYTKEYSGQYFGGLVSNVWKEYEKILTKEGALDFDDLLLKPVRLLKENEDILRRYQEMWEYIHIDEYQDTNGVQYELSKLLSQKHNNICVVGDVDQNIYSWRGANIRNMLDFEIDFPDVNTILLEENYRSTQNILTVANDIIDKNKERKEKVLYTKNREGEKLGVYTAYNEGEEARFVVQKAKSLLSEGVPAKEIAVLFRANFQSRVLEESFLSLGVPYQVLGLRFFDRKEVKDVLSFIHSSINPDSITHFKRIINVPPRGIGKVTLLKIVSNQEHLLSPAMKERVDKFKAMLRKIKEYAETKKPSETILFILKESGIEKSLTGGTDDDKERLENIQELVSLAKRYDKMVPIEAIEKLLEDASLATDQDNMREKEETIKLMTVHAAKGLEFKSVFITGLEEGLFPHSRDDSATREEQEEERRLFYVALTRAKDRLFLSHASTRTVFGSEQVNVPSEFLMDIDDVYLKDMNDEYVPTRAEKILFFD